MTGRQESDRKTEAKISCLLQNCPYIICDYYYSLTRKAASTKYAYLRYVHNFAEYLRDTMKKDITKIDAFTSVKPHDINRYMDYIKKIKKSSGDGYNKPQIRAARYFALSNFYNFLMIEDLIDKNPCERVEPPKAVEEKAVVAMTPTEITQLIKNIQDGCGSEQAKAMQKKWRNRDKAIVMLGCSTGLRVASISEINLSDINFTDHYINVVEKGNKVRQCYISQELIDILRSWISDRENILAGWNDTDALFISNRRMRMQTRTIEKMLDKYTDGFDKRITPHKMRSTYACNLYEMTGDIYLVQDGLGHRNISNTRRYTDVSMRQRQKASDLMGKLVSGK